MPWGKKSNSEKDHKAASSCRKLASEPTTPTRKHGPPAADRGALWDALADGTIAAGGTLGILIPPSVILVIYGIMTEQSIGALFAAESMFHRATDMSKVALVALVHHPLADERGLSLARRHCLLASERAALATAGRVITTSGHTARRLADFGVDSLITDFPGVAAQTLGQA